MRKLENGTVEKKVAIPREDLELDGHTWQKGLDYEAIFYRNRERIKIASDQGDVSYTAHMMENLNDVFEFVELKISS